ncbi:hypothetical protein THAOC_07002, partial [Thalassiosira oceanica]
GRSDERRRPQDGLEYGVDRGRLGLLTGVTSDGSSESSAGSGGPPAGSGGPGSAPASAPRGRSPSAFSPGGPGGSASGSSSSSSSSRSGRRPAS